MTETLDVNEENLNKAVGKNVVFIQYKTQARSKIIPVTWVKGLMVCSTVGKSDTFFDFSNTKNNKMIIY